MNNIDYLALYALLCLLNDLFLKNMAIRNIVDTLIAISGLYIFNIELYLSLPIVLNLIIGIFSKKYNLGILKTLTFLIIIYKTINYGFWNILIILFIYIIPSSLKAFSLRKNSLLVIDLVYSIGFFITGIWILMMNHSSKANDYINFQAPVAIILLIICVGKSLNILDSVSVLNIENNNLSKNEQLLQLIIKKFYIPILIVDLIKNNSSIITKENFYYLSVFITLYLILSVAKHIYEFKYIKRKFDTFILINNYFILIFILASIFIRKELQEDILLIVNYIIMLCSGYVLISKTKWNKYKPLFILLLLPTPVSLIFYKGIILYQELTLANFHLVAMTFIIILVFSFLTSFENLGKNIIEYEQLPNKT